MVVKAKRTGKNLGQLIRLDDDPMNLNTVLLHEFVVQVDLYESEALFVTFGEYGTAAGVHDPPEPITTPIPMGKRLNDDGDYEYYAKIPNKLFLTTGRKAASMAIKQPITGNPNQHFQITSGIADFTVYESLSGLEYEGIEENTVANLQAQMYEMVTDIEQQNDRIDEFVDSQNDQMDEFFEQQNSRFELQDERLNAFMDIDDSEANQVGVASAVVTDDGRLKLSNLKGEPGKVADAQWGINEPPTGSTIEWRYNKNV